MSEFWQNIFYAFVAELFVILTAWLVKEDKRKQVLVLGFGTAIAGIIGFGPDIIQTLSPPITTTPVMPKSMPTVISPQSTNITPRTVTQEIVLPTVTPTGKISYRSVSLAPIANHPMDNLASPLSGKYTFNGIPFSFLSGSKAVFQSQHHLLSSYPTQASLEVSIPHPKTIYILLNGAYVYKYLQGQTVGNITLKFDGYEPITTNLIIGQNLRENWAYQSGPIPESGEGEVITSITAPLNWQNVYVEPQSRGGKPAFGYIDLITISLPTEYQAATLIEIEIQDDSYDPSLVIYGITVSFFE